MSAYMKNLRFKNFEAEEKVEVALNNHKSINNHPARLTFLCLREHLGQPPIHRCGILCILESVMLDIAVDIQSVFQRL